MRSEDALLCELLCPNVPGFGVGGHPFGGSGASRKVTTTRLTGVLGTLISHAFGEIRLYSQNGSCRMRCQKLRSNDEDNIFLYDYS